MELKSKGRLVTWPQGKDRSLPKKWDPIIEIRLEPTCFNVLILFFSSFEHADYGPQQQH
jgi:hypothetical protein